MPVVIAAALSVAVVSEAVAAAAVAAVAVVAALAVAVAAAGSWAAKMSALTAVLLGPAVAVSDQAVAESD